MAKQTATVTVSQADWDGKLDTSSKVLADLDATANTKLTGIEASATADQTGAEIKTSYEAEANAYTDTKDTKLTSIEDSATTDQTGAEIQTAVEGLTDANRNIMISDPQTGEYKVHGAHRNAAGDLEYDYDDVAV